MDLTKWVVEGVWPSGSLRSDAPAEVRASRMVALRVQHVLSGDAAIEAGLSERDRAAVAALVAGEAWPDFGLMARLDGLGGRSMLPPRLGWEGVALEAEVSLGELFELTGRSVGGLAEIAALLGMRQVDVVELANRGDVFVFRAFGEAWLPRWQLEAGPGVGVVVRALPLSLPAVIVDRWMRRGAGVAGPSPLERLAAGEDPKAVAADTRQAFLRVQRD